MAMRRICNLTLASLLVLSVSGQLFAQEEGGSRRGGEGRSFEGQGGEGRAQGREGRNRERQNRRSENADESAGPQRTAVPVVPLPPRGEHTWLDEIADLEVQTTLLEKRDELAARRIDAQIRLKQKRTELDALERESTDEMLAYLPQVVAVMGARGKYQCQLFFPSGRVSYARAGDNIAPGVRVRSISPSGVEVDVLMGELSQQRRVPLNFVSLAERRGEDESNSGEGAVNPSELFRNIFGPRAPGGGAAGNAPRPAAPAARAARPRGAGGGN